MVALFFGNIFFVFVWRGLVELSWLRLHELDMVEFVSMIWINEQDSFRLDQLIGYVTN